MSKEKTESREKLHEEAAAEADSDDKEQNIQDADAVPEYAEASEDKELAQLVLDQQEQIAELEKKVRELEESNLRKKAELDNMNKRMQRERVQIYETSKAAAVEHFLPVNDDLQRTIEALENTEGPGKDPAGIEDGVRMIYNKFQEVLNKYNVEKIDQTGVPFNVDIHDALMRQEPEDENIESDIVLQVLENGYKMGNRTIRHAKVIVSE